LLLVSWNTDYRVQRGGSVPGKRRLRTCTCYQHSLLQADSGPNSQTSPSAIPGSSSPTMAENLIFIVFLLRTVDEQVRTDRTLREISQLHAVFPHLVMAGCYLVGTDRPEGRLCPIPLRCRIRASKNTSFSTSVNSGSVWLRGKASRCGARFGCLLQGFVIFDVDATAHHLYSPLYLQFGHGPGYHFSLGRDHGP
jgi:hypothetical protein